MAIQTAKINYTAAELEAAIGVIQSLLSVGSDNYVIIKTGSVEVKVPTEDLINSLNTNLVNLTATVSSNLAEINKLKSDKMDKTTFKTINGETIVGSGDIEIKNTLRYEEVE